MRNSIQTTFTLNAETIAKLQKLSGLTGKNQSFLVRLAVDRLTTHPEDWPKPVEPDDDQPVAGTA